MTVQRATGRGSPSGRSRTARRCCSNWPVRAPSIDQWPLLCGRIASSLTTYAALPPLPAVPPGRAGAAAAAHLEHLHGEHAGDIELPGDPQRRLGDDGGERRGQVGCGRQHLGADAVRLHRLDNGQAAAWPDGLRATRTASSRTKSTCSSSRRPSSGTGPPTRPSPRRGRPSALGRGDDADALAVIAAARGLRDDRPADARRRTPSTSSAVRARVQRGQAMPRASRRSRMASLSWAKCSAARLGWTATPSCSSASSTAGGTCSWSKVTTSHDRGEGPHRLEVGVVTDRCTGHHEGGGGGVALGEDARAGYRAPPPGPASSGPAGRHRRRPRRGSRRERAGAALRGLGWLARRFAHDGSA